MPRCARCNTFDRIHRTLWQHLLYTAVYECRDCKSRFKNPRKFGFRISRHARCPECGWRYLHRFARRDHIERMSRHPLSVLQHLLGAHLYFCADCRLQFYDLRRRLPEEIAAETPADRQFDRSTCAK
jgi:DNA-directed RNA polymerase subunit RPC12/RpoP